MVYPDENEETVPIHGPDRRNQRQHHHHHHHHHHHDDDHDGESRSWSCESYSRSSGQDLGAAGTFDTEDDRQRETDADDDGDDDDDEHGGFKVYNRRWLMLLYMSLLNLMSDWTCYSVAPISVLTSQAFGDIDPESLVTVFLGANAVASASEPMILSRLGLRRTVVFGALLLMVGSLIKSGGIPPLFSIGSMEYGQGGWKVYLGFFLVGLSQPLYQCTPALLSASWFPEKERTMATGVALNSNQLGIGCAFFFGTLLVATSDDILKYFGLLSFVSTITFVGAALQFDDAPPTPPSDTARVMRGTLEIKIPNPTEAVEAVGAVGRRLTESIRQGSFRMSGRGSLGGGGVTMTTTSSSGSGGAGGSTGAASASAGTRRPPPFAAPSPSPGEGPTAADAEEIATLEEEAAAATERDEIYHSPRQFADEEEEEADPREQIGYGSVEPNRPVVVADPRSGRGGTQAAFYNNDSPATPMGEGGVVDGDGAYYYQQPLGGYYSPFQLSDPHHGHLPYRLPATEIPLDEGAEPVLAQTGDHIDIDIRDDQVLLSLKACFHREGFVHCLAAFTVSGIVINTLSTYMDYLVRLGGAGREYVGIVGGTFQVLIMVSSLVLGKLTDTTRKYYAITLLLLVVGAFALAECGVCLDADRGADLRTSLLLTAVLVGPLQPVSTEMGVEIVYPLSENTVLVIQQLFANLLSALFIPIFKALKDYGREKQEEGMFERPQYTFSFYLLIVLHTGVAIFFATFKGRYLRFEAELEKKAKEEEKKGRRAMGNGQHPGNGHFFPEGDHHYDAEFYMGGVHQQLTYE